MKITIKIDPQLVKDVVESAGIGYWASEDEKGRIVDHENNCKKYRLTEAKIKRGLELMPTLAPNAFADILMDNTDAFTGDVLVQLALFGKVLYG